MKIYHRKRSRMDINCLPVNASRGFFVLCGLSVLLWVGKVQAQTKQAQKVPPVFEQASSTYCNPINIDYGYTPIENFTKWGKHRTTADPVIVTFKNYYYLFSTNQKGYWVSPDMLSWKFISRSFLRPWNHTTDDLCAPAVGIIGDTMLVFGSTYTRNFTIWMSTNPAANEWKPLVDSFDIGGWDPAFFTDTDGRFYMYNGSSNTYPLYGIELTRDGLHPVGTRKETYLLQDERYGWQRFGEHMDNTFLDPFIEGSWMTKHGGKYYLQYGAPGTESSGYSDGVLVGHAPLGPFVPQSDPLSFKPGGFARGAGHGATFKDLTGNYWHVSTIAISVKNNFERRIGIWPAGFDGQGVMWCNTAFGDYPHYLPGSTYARQIKDRGDYQASLFTGWMLLNYQKPVQVSSTLGGYAANLAVDEDIKTYWSAATGKPGEYIRTDLGGLDTVYAVQLNYADQDAGFLGKTTDQVIQYKLWISQDGQHWEMLLDKSGNQTDVPHDYIPLNKPVLARYLKLENVRIPSGKFAISGFRVFGHSATPPPQPVEDLTVLRTQKDKRSAWIKWRPADDATGYQLFYGVAPDKLYNAILVYNKNDYWLKVMDKEKPYYFQIEAFNEGGVSARTPVLKAP